MGNSLVARNASIIEINGNRYDAVSGQLIGAVKRVAAQVKTPAGGVVDGLVRRPALSITSSGSKLLQTGIKAQTPVNRAARQSIGQGALSVRQRVQRSQTLMRGAVKRPQAADRKTAISRFHKARTADINPIRASHAKTINKNAKVQHFGKSLASISPIRPKRVLSTQKTARAAANISNPSLQSVAPPLPSMVTSVSHQHLERLLDHALTQADTHKQALKSRTKGWRRIALAPKWLSVGASSLALLLLAGFFAWQNIPQVSMRLAATKAHVSASVPAYTPSGYSYAGPISAANNQVKISYKASANPQSSFAITQQASNWDSSSVAANAVPASSQVQTSQVNGTTVYIYGTGNDAKWVNHGVLFTLQDKANLSSDQILKIANGL